MLRRVTIVFGAMLLAISPFTIGGSDTVSIGISEAVAEMGNIVPPVEGGSTVDTTQSGTQSQSPDATLQSGASALTEDADTLQFSELLFHIGLMLLP